MRVGVRVNMKVRAIVNSESDSDDEMGAPSLHGRHERLRFRNYKPRHPDLKPYVLKIEEKEEQKDLAQDLTLRLSKLSEVKGEVNFSCFVVCYFLLLLFVVRGLLFVCLVYCCLFVCCLLFVVCCLLFVCLLFVCLLLFFFFFFFFHLFFFFPFSFLSLSFLLPFSFLSPSSFFPLSFLSLSFLFPLSFLFLFFSFFLFFFSFIFLGYHLSCPEKS